MSFSGAPVRLATVILTALLMACQPAAERYRGSELYSSYCSSCHGIYGDGYGPAAASIPQTIPDLRQIAASNGGTYPRELVARIIDGREIIDSHLSDTMPRWGQIFEIVEGRSASANRRIDENIEALVDYIESIQLPQ